MKNQQKDRHVTLIFGPSSIQEREEKLRWHVVAYDYGIKQNILRRLVSKGCKVTVVPALTSAEEVLSLKPDGVFLSNGPGDPAPLQAEAENVRRLFGRIPIFGICLGHQVLGLAYGGRTYKLKFGHRGGNHPVMNLATRKVEITAHNHGFAVDPDSLPASDVELTHINLNDQTLEGFRHRSLPVFSVQYHPEASRASEIGARILLSTASLRILRMCFSMSVIGPARLFNSPNNTVYLINFQCFFEIDH